ELGLAALREHLRDGIAFVAVFLCVHVVVVQALGGQAGRCLAGTATAATSAAATAATATTRCGVVAARGGAGCILDACLGRHRVDRVRVFPRHILAGDLRPGCDDGGGGRLLADPGFRALRRCLR